MRCDASFGSQSYGSRSYGRGFEASSKGNIKGLKQWVKRKHGSSQILGNLKGSEEICPDFQTLYWSATWPKALEQLARQFLYNSYKVIIGSADLKANHAIQQRVEIVSESQKYNKLIKLLEDIMDGSRILIYLTLRRGVIKSQDSYVPMVGLLCQYMVTKAKPKGIGSSQSLKRGGVL